MERTPNYLKRQYAGNIPELTPAQVARNELFQCSFNAHTLPQLACNVVVSQGGSQRASVRIFKDVATLVDSLEHDRYILGISLHWAPSGDDKYRMVLTVKVGYYHNEQEYSQRHRFGFYVPATVDQPEFDIGCLLRDYFYDRPCHKIEGKKRTDRTNVYYRLQRRFALEEGCVALKWREPVILTSEYESSEVSEVHRPE